MPYYLLRVQALSEAKILLLTTIGVGLRYSSDDFSSSIGLSFDYNLYIDQDALFVFSHHNCHLMVLML